MLCRRGTHRKVTIVWQQFFFLPPLFPPAPFLNYLVFVLTSLTFYLAQALIFRSRLKRFGRNMEQSSSHWQRVFSPPALIIQFCFVFIVNGLFWLRSRGCHAILIKQRPNQRKASSWSTFRIPLLIISSRQLTLFPCIVWRFPIKQMVCNIPTPVKKKELYLPIM